MNNDEWFDELCEFLAILFTPVRLLLVIIVVIVILILTGVIAV